jgi:hypothetical protein
MELQQEKKHKENRFVAAFDFFSPRKKENKKWKKTALTLSYIFLATQFIFALNNTHIYYQYAHDTGVQVVQVANIFPDFKKALDKNDSVTMQYDIVASASKNIGIGSSIASYMGVMAMNSDIPLADKQRIESYLDKHVWDGIKAEGLKTQSLKACNILDISCFVFANRLQVGELQKSYATQVAKNLYRMKNMADYKKYQQQLIDNVNDAFTDNYAQKESEFIHDILNQEH